MLYVPDLLGTEAAKLNAIAAGTDVATRTNAEMSNDDVVNTVVVTRNRPFDRDPSARSGLAGNREVNGLADANVAANHAADVKHDNPRSVRWHRPPRGCPAPTRSGSSP